jgi:UDPglucose 6-dehydrogenase
MNQCISIVGLGKLGIPMAACVAAKGFQVIGVDTEASRVEAINRGRAPILEPGLPDILDAAQGRLRATEDIVAAVAASELTFIVVPTPSDPDGWLSLRHVLPVAQAIGRAVREKKEFHLVVLTSTVMPGATDGEIHSALERASGKRCGVGFGLCYGPLFIALGSVICDFLNPDFVLIGESDPRSGATLEAFYKKVCNNNPRVVRMAIINAELTKLSVNTYLTTKISFANMLARICEKLWGADVDVVTEALGLDVRIGQKFSKGAVSYGGPCFPRDNLALAALARRIGTSADIAETTDRFNRGQVRLLGDLVLFHTNGGVAGILGLTYKPNTDVVEAAAGLQLAEDLLTRGLELIVYDPWGNENARRVLGERVRFAESAVDCIQRADAVVVATPWPEFACLAPEVWIRAGSPRIVIDCWNVLTQLRDCTALHYLRLGRGNPPRTSRGLQG